MLTYRPVIVPDDMEIIVTSLSDSGAFLTIDGQVGEPLQENDSVVCRRSEAWVLLIRPPRMRFFDVLREKLHWGER
jgi:NAD+ kinase